MPGAAKTPMTMEFERAREAAETLIAEYASLASHMRPGAVHQDLYNQLFEFCNLRVETGRSCLQLVHSGGVADALGLCRSLLEHYLLFILMCRGRRLFLLENQQKMSADEFNSYFEERRDELGRRQLAGETECLGVEKYTGERRVLMYIYEGHKAKDEPDFVVPTHYFQFQEFSPEGMRLDPADYFNYGMMDNLLGKARKEHRRQDSFRYRHLLSYEGLLRCLELNGIVDAASRPRIEAHYTFLGRFLHPTHDAARDLHDQSNYRYGGTSIGLAQSYSEDAKLLVCLYVLYLMAGVADEVAAVIESAPSKYVAHAGTSNLRRATSAVPIEFPYFWFVFNEAPLWDKFNHFVHASPQVRDRYNGYSDVPTDDVKFDQHIYGHLHQALGSWSNQVAGVYASPLQRYPV